VSLPLKLERAVARYLTGVAPYLIGGNGTYLITDNGLRVTLTSGVQFDFPIFTGQSTCEVSAPCIVAACPLCTQDNTTQCTLNHRCSVEVILYVPADADPGGLGTPQELLGFFEYAASQLVQALYRDDLATQLKLNEPNFTALFTSGPRSQLSGFVDRTRQFSVTFDVIATPAVL